jgi:hypothetical protein
LTRRRAVQIGRQKGAQLLLRISGRGLVVFEPVAALRHVVEGDGATPAISTPG